MCGVIFMCTRFYIEPDNEETRELIDIARRSKLADAFMKTGSAIQTQGEIDQCGSGDRNREKRKEVCIPHAVGLSDSESLAAGEHPQRNRRREALLPRGLAAAPLCDSGILLF